MKIQHFISQAHTSHISSQFWPLVNGKCENAFKILIVWGFEWSSNIYGKSTTQTENRKFQLKKKTRNEPNEQTNKRNGKENMYMQFRENKINRAILYGMLQWHLLNRVVLAFKFENGNILPFGSF